MTQLYSFFPPEEITQERLLVELQRNKGGEEVRILGLECDEAYFSELCDVIKKMPNLTTLSFRISNLKNGKMQILAKAINAMSKLTDLDLRWSICENMTSLAEVLQDTQITTLDLEGCKIEYNAAVALFPALPQTLTHLYLNNSNIGDTGAEELAEALPRTKITTLNLDNNDIGDDGVKELALVLLKTQITDLDLDSNDIGDKGAGELAKALPKTQITTLNLDNNGIEDKGAIALAKVLPETKITCLDLIDNAIGDTGREALENAIAGTEITVSFIEDEEESGQEEQSEQEEELGQEDRQPVEFLAKRAKFEASDLAHTTLSEEEVPLSGQASSSSVDDLS